MKKTAIVLSAILLSWSVGLFAQETETPQSFGGRVIRGISTVTAPPKPVIKVKEIRLDAQKITLFMGGEAQQLTATVSPERTDNKGINWRSSSNGAVAKVVDGLVSPVQIGTDTVFAVSQLDAKKVASCVVVVKIDSLAVYRAQYQALNTQLQENNGKVISIEDGKITYSRAHEKALLPDFAICILIFLILALLVFLFLLNRRKNKKIAHLEKVRERLEKQCATLEQKKNNLISEKNTLSAEVNRLQNTNTELRGEIADLRKEATTYEETIAKLQQQSK
ncbi:MAG: Ig-like domain-containing protein [Prevotellaceae bacterium]|jgi:uncharacterized protein YoxC|nr:Ig-like domain-containing protein [Prevotellaceae bacterium]